MDILKDIILIGSGLLVSYKTYLEIKKLLAENKEKKKKRPGQKR